MCPSEVGKFENLVIKWWNLVHSFHPDVLTVEGETFLQYMYAA